MTIGNHKEYIEYRISRARESYEDARILAENESWNSVINRLYYACFYSVIALLLTDNEETQTHDGSRIQFGLKYIKTGIIDKKYGKLYSKLFDFRQKGDYGDMFDFDKETALPLIESTYDFLEVIRKQIQEKNSEV